MIIRVWTTDIAPGRVTEYLQFANGTSLAMFLEHPGCLGVLFLRGEAPAHAVCSFWSNAAAVDAFTRSPRYAATVKAILATGVLAGVQTVTTYDIEGGELAAVMLARLASGDNPARR